MVYQIAFMLFFLTHPIKGAMISRSDQHRPDLNQIAGFKKALERAKKFYSAKDVSSYKTDRYRDLTQSPAFKQLEETIKHEAQLAAQTNVDPLRIEKSSAAYSFMEKLRKEIYEKFREKGQDYLLFEEFSSEELPLIEKVAPFLKMSLGQSEQEEVFAILNKQNFEDNYSIFRFADHLGLDALANQALSALAGNFEDEDDNEESIRKQLTDANIPKLHQDQIMASINPLRRGLLKPDTLAVYERLDQVVLSPDGNYLVGINPEGESSNEISSLILYSVNQKKQITIANINKGRSFNEAGLFQPTFNTNNQVVYIERSEDQIYTLKKYDIANRKTAEIIKTGKNELVYLTQKGDAFLTVDGQKITIYQLTDSKKTEPQMAMLNIPDRYRSHLYCATSPDGKVGALLSENYNSSQYITLFSLESMKLITTIAHNFGRIAHADFFFTQDSLKLVLLGQSGQTDEDLIIDLADRSNIKPYYIAPEKEILNRNVLFYAVMRGFTYGRLREDMDKSTENVLDNIVRDATLSKDRLIAYWQRKPKLFLNYHRYTESKRYTKLIDLILKPLEFDRNKFNKENSDEQEKILRNAVYSADKMLETIKEVRTSGKYDGIVNERLEVLADLLEVPEAGALSVPDELVGKIMSSKRLQSVSSVSTLPQDWVFTYHHDEFPSIWNMNHRSISTLTKDNNIAEDAIKTFKVYNTELNSSLTTLNLFERAKKGKGKDGRYYYDLGYIRNPKYPQLKAASHKTLPIIYTAHKNWIFVWDMLKKIRRQSVQCKDLTEIEAIQLNEDNRSLLVSGKEKLCLINLKVLGLAKTEITPQPAESKIGSHIRSYMGAIARYLQDYFKK